MAHERDRHHRRREKARSAGRLLGRERLKPPVSNAGQRADRNKIQAAARLCRQRRCRSGDGARRARRLLQLHLGQHQVGTAQMDRAEADQYLAAAYAKQASRASAYSFGHGSGQERTRAAGIRSRLRRSGDGSPGRRSGRPLTLPCGTRNSSPMPVVWRSTSIRSTDKPRSRSWLASTPRPRTSLNGWRQSTPIVGRNRIRWIASASNKSDMFNGRADRQESRKFMAIKRTLIQGGQVYDHEGDVHKPAIGDILIEDDKVVSVGANLPRDGVNEIIDASGRLVVPGLINAHYHSHDTLCRGLFEELPLEIWLLYTLPMGGDRSKEEVRARTLVGALECLRCGITTVQDMLGLSPLNDENTDVVVDAYRESGIRVVFSPMVWDIPPIGMVRHKDSLPLDVQEMLGNKPRPIRAQFDYLEHQFERHPAGGTLHWAVAPFAPQRCTPKMLQGCAELADKHDLAVYTHVYETRGQVLIARELFADHDGSLITYMGNVGLLGPRLNIVHSVWISRSEIDRMAAAA